MNEDRVRAVRQLMLDHGGDDSAWWAGLADGIVKLLDLMERPEWLVWSNQHGQWWRGGRAGYTQYIEEAGRYSRAEAEAIVRQATVDGQLSHGRRDPYTGQRYVQFDEVLVPAPDTTWLAGGGGSDGS